MNNPNDYRQSQLDNEISLVDLATILIRRRRVFYTVFTCVVGIALLYALLLVGEVREYSTLVQLGEDDDKPLESPQSVIASIESYWYPELLSEYRVKEGENLAFKISVLNPDGTSLIKLTSEASPELAEKVETYHEKLVGSITERQADFFNRQKRELEERLASMREYLKEMSAQESTGEAQAQVIRERTGMRLEIESITARINSLKPAQTLVVARKSLENKGTSKKLILALAIVLGLMLGIFSAFMAEFGTHVRQAMKDRGEIKP